MKDSGVDKVLKWTCVVGYFTSWLLVLSAGLKWDLLAPAIAVACVYAGMHYYEMVVRSHLALSADSTAMPVTLIVTGMGAFAAYFGGVAQRDIFDFALKIPFAFLGGHVVVFGVVFLMHKLGIGEPKS